MIAPLTKRKPNGATYTRPESIETRLAELVALPRTNLIARCKIQREDDTGFVPSECVLHFVRAYRAQGDAADFERLYRILLARFLSRLPSTENTGGETASLSKTKINEAAYDKFVGMLMEDRGSYCDKLDFYEVRFNKAIKTLMLTAQRDVWRAERGMMTIEGDEDSGDPTPEVEDAAGSYNPFEPVEFDPSEYESKLDIAIDLLPELQRAIVQMIRKGIPIDSTDPVAVTIARTLKRAEKTIRTHRDKAYAKLKTALTAGE